MKNILTVLAALLALGLAAAPAAADPAHHPKVQKSYRVQGEVVAVDRAASKLRLKHDKVPELQWPGMTMDFAVADGKLLEALQPGQKGEFQFELANGAARVTGFTAAQ